jgi:hypothetical protein
MKTLLLVPATFAMAAVAMAQTTVYEANFSTPPAGTAPITSNWQQKGNLTFQTVARDGDATNQMLECRSTGQQSADSRLWLSGVPFPDGTGKMVIEFETRLIRSNSQGFQGNIHIGSFPAAPGVKPEGMAVILSFRGSGRLCTFDGDTETEIGNWKDGEWMKFRVEIDPEAKTFAVTQGEELLAADYAFRDAKAAPIRAFGMTYYTGANPSKESAMSLDSIKISTL